jgi:DNA repair exonuclease SbcCD ATPase subunit
VVVLVRRVDNEEDPVARERQALADQRTALDALRRQLSERITAVREREEELRSAIARVEAGKAPAVALPPKVDPTSDRLAARAAALAERERAVAAREAALASGAPGVAAVNGDAALAEREAKLEALSRELDARERALEERERIPRDPDAARLAEIEARLDELRAAEEAFLRTRRELADHSDAIAAREQLLAQRERELDEREDGWGGPDVRELEARLRKLETQRTAIGRTQGFSGGFRRLEQEGARRPPSE